MCFKYRHFKLNNYQLEVPMSSFQKERKGPFFTSYSFLHPINMWKESSCGLQMLTR